MQIGGLFAGLGICDSADDVIAESSLRVEGGFCSQASACPHVDQFGDNGGCAEIHSQAEYRLGLRIGLSGRPIINVPLTITDA